MIQYLDKKGRLLFVSKGIGQDCYATFFRTHVSGIHRVKSPDLPVRKTMEKAGEDFSKYVKKHGLVPVTIGHQEN
jgi:hypothetical protein